MQSILDQIRAKLTPAQRSALESELLLREQTAYTEGRRKALGELDSLDSPRRPIISDSALRYLKGLAKSSTIRLGAAITAASTVLLDDHLRTHIAELLGPRAYPMMGILAGVAMLIQRVRTVMSIAERGGSDSKG